MTLKIFLLLILLLSKMARSFELFSIGDEYIPFIIDVCKFYGTKSIIFLYAKSMKEMEMTTTLFKWTRALSQENFTTTSLYFSELEKSSYYMGRIVRPHYIAVISNYNAINEFSLATSTFDMSYPLWLMIFFYKGHGSDYCHNPPGNIFHLKFNSEMLVRCGTENILREWYSLDTNRTDIDYLGTWNSKEGIVLKVSGSLYERRNNLKGSIIRVTYVKDSAFVNLNENNELDGLFGILFKELSTTLNFSYSIVELKKNESWNNNENSWSEALNEIISGRADISLADFSMNSDRLNYFDFSLPIIIGENNLFFREADKFTIKWSSYFRIFSYLIWVSIIGILIVASILLVFLKIKNGTSRKIWLLSSDTFFEVLGIFFQQGLTNFPDSSSLRIAYFSIFILTVTLSAAYSAILICYLTTPTHVLPFRSLEDFVNDGTYQISTIRDSNKYNYLSDSFKKELMKFMIDKENLPVNLLEGFRKICDNPKLTLYTYYDMKRDAIFKMPCNVNYIKTGIVENLAFVLSKDYPFTDIINTHLQKYISNGMIIRLKDKIFKKKYNDIKNEHHPVNIYNIITLICLIQVGIILSICILVIEIYVFGYNNKK